MSFDFGAGAIETGIQAYHNYEMQKRSQEFTREMYEEQIKQRDYMNEYNSPANQMLRFKEAGLNKHLIYSKGTPGNQTFTPTKEHPKMFPTEFKGSLSGLNPLGALSMYQDWKQKQANVSLTNAQIQTQNLKNKITSGSAEAIINKKIEEMHQAKSKTKSAQERALYDAQLKQYMEHKAGFEKERTRMLVEEGINLNDHFMWRQLDKRGGDAWEWLFENMFSGNKGSMSGNMFMGGQ